MGIDLGTRHCSDIAFICGEQLSMEGLREASLGADSWSGSHSQDESDVKDDDDYKTDDAVTET